MRSRVCRGEAAPHVVVHQVRNDTRAKNTDFDVPRLGRAAVPRVKCDIAVSRVIDSFTLLRVLRRAVT